MGYDEELKSLDEAIESGSGAPECMDYHEVAELYFRRGKLLYRMGELGRAKNDFLKVRELLDSSQVAFEQKDTPDDIRKSAAEYIKMIENILEFRYTDTYNP